LTDVFAPIQQTVASPAQSTPFFKKVSQIHVAKDVGPPTSRATSPLKSPAIVGLGKENAPTSPFRAGSPLVEAQPTPRRQPSPKKLSPVKAVAAPEPPQPQESEAENRNTTDESFVSANEGVEAEKQKASEEMPAPVKPVPASQSTDIQMNDVDSAYGTQTSGAPSQALSFQQSFTNTQASAIALPSPVPDAAEEEEPDAMDVDGYRSPSDGSSPVKPFRNHSLSFAPLPARETIGRISRTSHLEHGKSLGASRGSNLGRFTGGKSLGGSQNVFANSTADNEDPMELDDEENQPPTPQKESEASKMHNKTSTQRLHEKINMLKKAKEDSTSSQSNKQPLYPQLATTVSDKPQEEEDQAPKSPEDAPRQMAGQFDFEFEADDEDWIAPVRAAAEELRPQLMKSMSTDVMENIHGKASIGGLEGISAKPATREGSPLRKLAAFGHHKSSSETNIVSPVRATPPRNLAGPAAASQPMFNAGLESTTPAGSPPRKYMDGALSASKSKLYSVLKFAKDKFVSSASTSAQAKMEVLSPNVRPNTATGSPSRAQAFSPAPESRPKTAMGEAPNPVDPPPTQAVRKTRSSSEREREEQRKQKESEEAKKAEEQLEKARENERKKAAIAQKQEQAKAATKENRKLVPGKAISRPGTAAGHRAETEAGPANEMASSTAAGTKKSGVVPPQKTGQLRRVGNLSKDQVPRAKPAPVAVSLASQRAGRLNNLQASHGPSAAPSSSAPESSQSSSQPQPPKRPVVTKASNPSLHSSTSSATNNTLKTSTSASSMKARALEAAKRKEQEERLAAKKAESKQVQRPETQRKVTATQRLEEQRAAQRKAEAAKAADAKKTQQEQRGGTRPPSRQANKNLANALQQEKANAGAPHPRGDLNTARPLNKMNVMPELSRPIPPVNPAKPPPKRHLQDGEDAQPQRPAIQRNPSSYQQMDAKRRKTNELDEDSQPQSQQQERRSVMAPPIRQSNIRKVSKSSFSRSMKHTNLYQDQAKFAHGYMQAPSGAAHPGSSMFKTTVTAQHQQKQQIRPVQNDMSKFASGKIPFADAPNPSAGPSSSAHYSQHQQSMSQFRTPARPPTAASASTAKPSPSAQLAENIELPDIATDSEDEDSDDGFQAASWTESPALRELLLQQQTVDPHAIFGPIAPLDMAGMFPESKHRFRKRTSSANWTGADRLTEEDRRRDREGREKVHATGGWTYSPRNL
jgi:hypothetical protein